jgi:hypothetical protein
LIYRKACHPGGATWAVGLRLAGVLSTMPAQSVIVWDLETVPDLGGFAAANDLVGRTDADIRAVLGNKFPKHIYHTVVCIGAALGMSSAMSEAALSTSFYFD